MRALAAIAAAGLVTLVAASATHGAERNGERLEVGGAHGPTETILPADSKWYYSATSFNTEGPDSEGSWMIIPCQDALWKVSSSTGVMLMITDSWVTGDRFEVYVDGTKVLTTPAVAAYQVPEIDPDVPAGDPPKQFTEQQKLTDSFNDVRYTSGMVQVAQGDHTINVKSIAFPPKLGGAGFALKAVPDPPTSVDATSWGAVKRLYR